jgi:membrane-bound serine protease (ClpP class)
MRARGIVSLVMWLSGAILMIASAAAQPAGREVVVGEIKGIINPVMAGYVSRVIDEAERSNAAAVVFYMDTPGGLSDAMRDINLRILASRVPVVVYVAPDGARAGSAGAYIAYAAHVAAMAPATNIGSATPVAFGDGREQQMSQEMRNKVTNDAVAQIRALAEQRGRNPDFAEQAVRDGANLHASEALRQKVVNHVASDLRDLLRQMHGAPVQLVTGEVTLETADTPIRRVDMSALESFLLTITNPTIAYILLSLGSLGLILELYNPGSIFPGVIGGICLLLAFYALGTLPVNFAALALIAFGLGLFALEPFVVSHGILGVGGAIAFLMGSLLLINAPESAPFLQVSLVAILAMTGVMLAFFFVLLGAVLRSRRRKVVTGREGLLGAMGVARTDLRPGQEGVVHVQSEQWRAVTVGAPIAAGEKILVEQIDGLLLTVRSAAISPAEPVKGSATARVPKSGTVPVKP